MLTNVRKGCQIRIITNTERTWTPSLRALGLVDDHGHAHDDHSHDVMAEWPAPSALEHPEERTDRAHNWGTGRNYKQNIGQETPVPIISTLPVRSRSRGRWDGDGM